MTVVWSREAERALDRIFDYVLADDPGAAERLRDRIEARVLDLKSFPRLGWRGLRHGTRELVVPGTPYVVIYRTRTGRIDILAVLHGARDRRP